MDTATGYDDDYGYNDYNEYRGAHPGGRNDGYDDYNDYSDYNGADRGKAVQIDPIKPTLKPPGIKLLELKYDKQLSNFASKFNLRRYIVAVDTQVRIIEEMAAAAAAAAGAAAAGAAAAGGGA